jgi:hypothetical protein
MLSAIRFLGKQSCEREGFTADDAVLSLSSATDRIFETITSNEQDANGIWQVTRRKVYAQENSDAAKLIVTSRRKLAGFGGGEISQTETTDIYGATSKVSSFLNGYFFETQTLKPGKN